MRLLARAAAVSTTSLLVIGVVPGQSFAAGEPNLVSASPAAGAYVKLDPSTISATFDVALSPTSSITVAGPGATFSCNQSVNPPANSLACTPSELSGSLTEGLYTVDYTATASGLTGTSRTGQFAFTLDKTAPAAPTGLTIAPTPYVGTDKTAGTPITVSGTSEVGATVLVGLTSSGGGASPAAQTVTTNATTGAFTATFTNTLNDGTLTATATATDRAGNVGTAATKTGLKDTTGPTVVSSTPPAGGSVQPGLTSNTYDVVASEALGQTASTLAIKDDTGAELLSTRSFPNATTIRATATLSEGAYTATVTLVDQYGNASAGVTRAFTVDGTKPASPVITAPAKVNNANKAAYVVSGTGEVGATVTLTLTAGATVTTTATVNGSGAWTTSSLDVSGLTDGGVALSATQADAAGNTAAAPGTATTTKDVVLPVVTALAFDRTTYSTAQPTATITATLQNGAGAAEGDAWTISIDDTDGTTAPVTASGTAGSNGLVSTAISLATLKDGTLTVTAVATDASGNPSAAATATASKDTNAPVTPTVVVTPSSVNKANQAAVVVTGKTEAGASVVITISGATGSPVTKTVSANGTGDYTSGSLDLTTLPDGVLTVSVVASDVLGNPSVTGTATATKDTVVPADPTLTVPAFVNTANQAAVPVSGTGEVGATITLTASDGTATPAVTKALTVPVGGTWSTTLDLHTLADGTITVVAAAKDAANNPATSTATRTTVKDTVAPGVPATLTASAYVYADANATPAHTFTVSGTTAAGDSSATGLVADLTVTGGATTLTQLNVPVTSGAFSYAFTAVQVATLPDGPLALTAVLHDSAGNTSPQKAGPSSKDTTKLAVVASSPATPVNAPASASAAFNEALSQSTSTLVVKNKNGNAVAGATTFSADGKTVTFTPTSAFSEVSSPYTAVVSGVDVGDAADTASKTYSFTVDSTAPLAPVITSSPTITPANQAAYTVAGTGEVGATVTLTLGSLLPKPTATVISGGTWTVTFNATSLPDGTLTASATQADAAGNASPASAPASVVKDTTGATVTGLGATGTNIATPSTSITGSTEPGAAVALSASDGTHPAVTGAGTVSPTGAITGTLNVSGLNDGTITVTATATDSLGNVGAPSTTTFVKDSVAPSVTGLAATAVTVAKPSTTVTGTTTSAADAVALSATDGTLTVTGTATVTTGGSFSGTLDLTTLMDTGNGVSITVRATPTDTAGNTGAAAAQTLSKDGTAPAITGLAATPTSTATPSTTVTGTRSESSSVVVTATDGTTSVSQPVTAGTGSFSVALDLSTLANGQVIVTAVATDAAGNMGTATTSTSKDATPPVVTGLTASSTNVATTATTVNGTVSEAATVVLTITSSAGSASKSITAAAGAFSTTVELGALADGTFTVSVTSTDTAGNAGTAVTTTGTKDATAPVVTGLDATDTNAATATSTISGSVSEAATLAISATDGTATVSKSASGSGAFSATLDLSTLADGIVTISVTPTDAAGNPGTTQTTDVSKDATAPVITGLAATATNEATPVSTITGSVSGTASVLLSATDGMVTVSTTVTVTGAFTATLDLSTLADGTTTVTATATDAAGNTGTATTTAKKDATAPTVAGFAVTDVNATTTSTTVRGTASEALSLVITATDTASGSATKTMSVPVGAFTTTLDVTPLANGTFTVTATPTDAAGNTGTAATTTAVKDATAPSTMAAPQAVAGDKRAGVYFAALASGEGVVSYVVTGHRTSGPDVTVSAGSSPALVPGLLNGVTYTFTVRATDVAGNASPASPASNAVTPKGTSSTALSALPAKVVYGTRITLAGKVTRSDASAAPGKVTLNALYDNGTGAGIGTVTPAADGTYSFAYVPKQNVRFSASYAGDAKSNAGTASPARKVLVAVLINRTYTRTTTAASVLTIKGTVAPVKKGTVITLNKMVNGKAVYVAKVALSSTSAYTFSLTLPRGSYTLQLVVPTTTGNAGNAILFPVTRS